jgi:hypothetical protein
MFARRHVEFVLFVLLGSLFLTRYLENRHGRDQISPMKPTPTTYLDGMRGVGAFVVFFCHCFYQAFVISIGKGCKMPHYDILKLPILRLWF